MIVKEKCYVLMSKSHLYDKDLSLSSKGLLTILLSGICETNGHFDFSKFRMICADEREAEEAFFEMIELGYIESCCGDFIVREYPLNKKRPQIPEPSRLKEEKIEKRNNPKDRNSAAYSEWRKFVFKRDNYTCQMCGKRGGSLNAHHIKPWAKYPDFRLDKENGVTLCEKCHKYVHKKKV